MKYLFMVVIICVFHSSNAQTINPSTDNVRWVYNSVQNLLNGEILSMAGTITSYGDSRFVWEQNGMSTTYEFKSNSTSSTWSSANSDGQLETSATCNGVSGIVKIERSGNSVTIELNFKQAGKLTPHLILTVNSFSKI